MLTTVRYERTRLDMREFLYVCPLNKKRKFRQEKLRFQHTYMYMKIRGKDFFLLFVQSGWIWIISQFIHMQFCKNLAKMKMRECTDVFFFSFIHYYYSICHATFVYKKCLVCSFLFCSFSYSFKTCKLYECEQWHHFCNKCTFMYKIHAVGTACELLLWLEMKRNTQTHIWKRF